MSTGRRTRHSDTHRRESLSRYDIVLALIPVVLVLTAVTAQLLSIELPLALVVGAVMTTVAVVDALFVNPPTGRSQ